VKIIHHHIASASAAVAASAAALTATNWSFSILMTSPTTTLCHSSSTSFPSRSTLDNRLFTWLSLRWRCYDNNTHGNYSPMLYHNILTADGSKLEAVSSKSLVVIEAGGGCIRSFMIHIIIIIIIIINRVNRPQFSWGRKFWAKPRNFSDSMEFLCFHGILWNLVLAGDYFYFPIYFQVWTAFWQKWRLLKLTDHFSNQ